jgi:hypothetical protein
MERRPGSVQPIEAPQEEGTERSGREEVQPDRPV